VAGSNKNTAEERFRESFERLKLGQPIVLPKGTPVSQNNVAKEADCDPSALRKKRFPSLIAEIQQYVESNKGETPDSNRQKMLQRSRRNRDTREIIADLKKQHSEVVGLLADANYRIVELTEELEEVRRKLEEIKPSNVTTILDWQPKKDD
jgi:uncharacterized membrane protein